MPRATPLAARNDTPKVGARVRSLRRERGLTIEQLAAATGLTKGFISQLERDRTAPSLSSIARICDALGVRLSHIFEREPAPALVRRNERPKVDSHFPTENHLLSSRDEERFQAIESEVAPGAGAGDELYSLPGEMEFVYVLDGTHRAAGRATRRTCSSRATRSPIRCRSRTRGETPPTRRRCACSGSPCRTRTSRRSARTRAARPGRRDRRPPVSPGHHRGDEDAAVVGDDAVVVPDAGQPPGLVHHDRRRPR